MTATRKVLQRFLNKHDLEGTSTPHQGGEDLSTPTHDVMVSHRPSSTFTHADYHTGSIHSSRSLSSGLLRHDSSRPSFYLSLNSAREPPSHQSLTSDHDGLGKAHEDPTPVTSTPGLGDSGLEDMGDVEFSTLLELQQQRRLELAQEKAANAGNASTASTASLGLEGGKGEEGAMAAPRKNLRGRSGQRRHTLASSTADPIATPESSFAASTQPSGEPSAQPPIPPQPTQPPPPPPSSKPSGEPSGEPSDEPSSSQPTQPSDEPSSQPSAQPSVEPASQPSMEIRSAKRTESMDRESKAVETQPPEPRGDAPPPAVTASSRVFSFDDSLEKAEKVPAFSANQINRL